MDFPLPLTLVLVMDEMGLDGAERVGVAARPAPEHRHGHEGSSGVFPVIGANAAQEHILTLRVSDDCTVTSTTSFTSSLVKFEVIGAS